MFNETFTNQSLLFEQGNESPLDSFLSKNIFYFETSLYILYSLIFLFGVLGNTIVIYVLVTSLCVNRHIQVLSNELTTIHKTNNAVRANFIVPPAAQATSAHLFNNSFKNSIRKKHNDENSNRKNHEHLAANYTLNNEQIEYDCKKYFFF
jgi:ABC-type multidrug transport system fused ATPase/permease subunit